MVTSVPEEIFEPLCTAVGHMVVNWTFVDTAMSHLCAIYHSAGGKHEEPELPKNQGRKIKFLRRCFSRIEGLSGFRAEALPLLVEADRLGDCRNFIAHGTIAAYDANADHLLTFVKVDPDDKRTMHEETELKITLAALLRAGSDCRTLTTAMLKLAHRLIKVFITENQAQQAPRRL